MQKVNTHLSNNCKTKCNVYIDANGHYHLERLSFVYGKGFERVQYGRTKFKHIESLNRAVNKWINN